MSLTVPYPILYTSRNVTIRIEYCKIEMNFTVDEEDATVILRWVFLDGCQEEELPPLKQSQSQSHHELGEERVLYQPYECLFRQ